MKTFKVTYIHSGWGNPVCHAHLKAPTAEAAKLKMIKALAIIVKEFVSVDEVQDDSEQG